MLALLTRGIVEAVKKAHKVKEALDSFTKASEFWEWYDRVILEKNELENDYKTYRDIFEKLEQDYWNGRNKNTKRKRSRDIPSDVRSFKTTYGKVFKKFPNWDKSPEWEEIKDILFSWKQGTKTFKDAYFTLKKVCSLAHNSESLVEKLEQINFRQLEFSKRQSVSLNDFLSWHETTKNAIELTKHPQHKKAKKSWLWVSAMCVLYGLRPSEIAAAQNLATPVTIDGYTFKAINDPSNKEMLLVLGEFTYFGATIKTGKRVCIPMVVDEELLNKLNIR
ncbi:MAG: recombinase, partial [Kamptonema sp. SIO4C4]|nr:recombinase [Kamptonema sp. SIO4C4]